jgi:hypothetical protein
MLTCKPISVQKAELYFTKGYYLQESSRWSGHGAKILKLSGAIDNQKCLAISCRVIAPVGAKD